MINIIEKKHPQYDIMVKYIVKRDRTELKIRELTKK